MSLVEKAAAEPAPRKRGAGVLQVKIIEKILAHLACGRMTIKLSRRVRGVLLPHQQPGPDAVLEIHRWRTVWRTITRGDMGFAESFIDGDCSSPDIAKVVELFVRNEAMLARIAGWPPVHFLNKPDPPAYAPTHGRAASATSSRTTTSATTSSSTGSIPA